LSFPRPSALAKAGGNPVNNKYSAKKQYFANFKQKNL